METLQCNDAENVSVQFPRFDASSKMLQEPPTSGAKELGEELTTTLMEMAKSNIFVKDKRKQAVKEIFEKRNLANNEWQLLDTKGKEERQSIKLDAERRLAEITQLTQSNIQKQKDELKVYAEEAKRLLEKRSQEEEMCKTKLKEETETSMNSLLETQRKCDVLRNRQLLISKQETLKKIISQQEKTQKKTREMEELHLRKLEEIKREETQILKKVHYRKGKQQILAEEKHEEENLARAGNFSASNKLRVTPKPDAMKCCNNESVFNGKYGQGADVDRFPGLEAEVYHSCLYS